MGLAIKKLSTKDVSEYADLLIDDLALTTNHSMKFIRHNWNEIRTQVDQKIESYRPRPERAHR